MTSLIQAFGGQVLASRTTGVPDFNAALLNETTAIEFLPVDPLFTAPITLNNITGGSRYRITRRDTGAELATGVVSGTALTDLVVSAVPAYANPMQFDVTVRNASGSPVYRVFDTAGFHGKAGSSVYILQQLDE